MGGFTVVFIMANAHVFLPPTVKKRGIAVGLGKGYLTTPRKLKPRIRDRKGRLTPRLKLIRGVIREVMGLAPYEKRVIEILRINNTKRAKKFLRKRLGTQRAALRKRQEMANIMAEQNKKQAAEDAARKEAEKAKKALKEARKAKKAEKKKTEATS